ncbi:MAG: Pyruvate carboxylase subunit A [Methanosaeta sp. PtaB.Bin087]|nr:MAG: Pyruvate carboxylase subunit A [Methanosaeta sp. PtaB.Bin087]
MEINARIQVEHPVTEMVTGVDLVQWQIRVAAGETLNLRADATPQSGSAIECRINAEDPDHNFRPSPGRIEEFILPGGPGVRVDTHAYAGYTVSPHYDSLLAKLLVHRPTRAEAISAMRRALDEFRIGPIKTTIPIHQQILAQPDFVRGNVDTSFIERTFAGPPRASAPPGH